MMRPPTVVVALLLTVGPAIFSPAAFAATPEVDSFALQNGIRVVVIEIAEGKNVSIFTFLPMGLAADGPGQAQWAHLIEHLVIRSTLPVGSELANAETLSDHMRLDFYGKVDNWQEGVSHHARWLTGVPFTEENLQREKPKVNAECDFTAKRLATHKFAFAAWGQGFRHGRAHAALKGDVRRATLGEIQEHRDKHLAVLEKTVVCIVGGLSPKGVRPVVTKHFGEITSTARSPQAVKVTESKHEMTWDLDARHLVLSWPIPCCTDGDFPSLVVAGQLLMTRYFADSDLNWTAPLSLKETT